jgi:hypothetical protein
MQLDPENTEGKMIHVSSMLFRTYTFPHVFGSLEGKTLPWVRMRLVTSVFTFLSKTSDPLNSSNIKYLLDNMKSYQAHRHSMQQAQNMPNGTSGTFL